MDLESMNRRMTAAGDAMTALVEIVRATDREKSSGSGVMPCSLCGGQLRYGWRRVDGRGRQSLTYSGRCDTDRCLTFSGH